MFLGLAFKKKSIASFSWGEHENFTLKKAWEINKNIALMIGEELDDNDYLILESLHSRLSEINL